MGALQTVSAPADRSVLGTGMERGPEPLVPAAPAVDLLLDGSAALCACLSGDSSSSIIGLHLQAAIMQVHVYHANVACVRHKGEVRQRTKPRHQRIG